MSDTRQARVGLVLDPCFERHRTGPAHHERPERLVSISDRLNAGGLVDRTFRSPIVSASDLQLERVHSAEYVRRVAEACLGGEPMLDSTETEISSESETIARKAAGSLAALACAVADGELDRGFAAVRPPGHHAERAEAMGFCLFNSVAVAARELTASGRASRLLIVDWDVHHGNGTQHLFETSDDVFFFSVHQSPLYPGTGASSERGRDRGVGTTRNVPLPPGAGDDRFLDALRGPLVEDADAFSPDFVLVSAGFDAHRSDPLAQLDVSTEAFGEATRIVLEIARRHASGRFVSTLEGGYDLAALAESAAIHLRVLLDTP